MHCVVRLTAQGALGRWFRAPYREMFNVAHRPPIAHAARLLRMVISVKIHTFLHNNVDDDSESLMSRLFVGSKYKERSTKGAG